MKNKLCALSLILLLISCSDEIQQFDDSTKQTQNENKELQLDHLIQTIMLWILDMMLQVII